MATGGALGGVFVGLLAPALFSGFYELELGMVFVLAALALRQTSRWAIRRGVAAHRRGGGCC